MAACCAASSVLSFFSGLLSPFSQDWSAVAHYIKFPCMSYITVLQLEAYTAGTLTLPLLALVVAHHTVVLRQVCIALQAPHSALWHTNIGVFLSGSLDCMADHGTRMCHISAFAYALSVNCQLACGCCLIERSPSGAGCCLPPERLLSMQCGGFNVCLAYLTVEFLLVCSGPP